jgi:hypothetical protein
MSSLQRLFQSNIRMSPSRSRKPLTHLKSRRNALNRAAHALTELKEARAKHAQLTRNIQKLESEYYKLARRAAIIRNANMKSGPLRAHELNRLRHTANMIRTISVAKRTMKRTPLPVELQNMVARATLPPRRV